MFAGRVAEFVRIPRTDISYRLNSYEFSYEGRRQAITLLEITVAAAMLAVLMTVTAQMLRALGNQQRATERRAIALQTVQFLSEQVGNIPWHQLTEEEVRDAEVPAAVKPFLPPGCNLTIRLHEEVEPVTAKRVTVELTWNGPSGQLAGPAKLTSWVFADAAR